MNARIPKPVEVGDTVVVIGDPDDFMNRSRDGIAPGGIHEVRDIDPGGSGYIMVAGSGFTLASDEYLVVATVPAPEPRYRIEIAKCGGPQSAIHDEAGNEPVIVSERYHPAPDRLLSEERDRLNDGYYDVDPKDVQP